MKMRTKVAIKQVVVYVESRHCYKVFLEYDDEKYDPLALGGLAIQNISLDETPALIDEGDEDIHGTFADDDTERYHVGGWITAEQIIENSEADPDEYSITLGEEIN